MHTSIANFFPDRDTFFLRRKLGDILKETEDDRHDLDDEEIVLYGRSFKYQAQIEAEMHEVSLRLQEQRKTGQTEQYDSCFCAIFDSERREILTSLSQTLEFLNGVENMVTFKRHVSREYAWYNPHSSVYYKGKFGNEYSCFEHLGHPYGLVEYSEFRCEDRMKVSRGMIWTKIHDFWKRFPNGCISL